MRQILVQVSLEFKSMRLNRLSIGIGMIALPIAYGLIALLTQPGSGVEIAHVLSGVLVASLVSSLFMLTTLRVSNIFQPDVLELYAALPVRKTRLLMGSWLTYVLVSLPQATVVFVLSAVWAPDLSLGVALLALLSSYLMVLGIASWLGLAIRNPYKAQGIASLVTWGMVLISPIHPAVQDLSPILRILLLINPATHAMNMVRSALGLEAVVSPAISFGFALAIIALTFPVVLVSARRITILEKLF